MKAFVPKIMARKEALRGPVPALLILSLVFFVLATFLVERVKTSSSFPAIPATRAPVEWEQAEVVLANRCVRCHGPHRQKSGLRLDSSEHALRGGVRGPVLEPGHPERSLLVLVLDHRRPDMQMPPGGRLDPDEVTVLENWITDLKGAQFKPANGVRVSKAASVFDRQRGHWAYQPLHAAAVPVVPPDSGACGPIDAFIHAGLRANRLQSAPDADRRALIRRVTFDLIGLPPTRAEIEAFEHDSSPNPYEKVVDRLLSSPHFGERWARHWLDLVRYGESRGYENDHDIPHPWPYRDYLIRAFNADIPYDQVVREHVAGDLMPPRLHQGANQAVLGTGFWHLGEWLHSPVDIRRDEADRLDNQIDVFGKTFLGQTLACARCHDHKFDPIRQADYYALAGFLRSSNYRHVHHEDWEREEQVERCLQRQRKELVPILATAHADLLCRVVAQLADYLQAARQVVVHGRSADNVARELHLSSAVLSEVVRDVKQAANGPDHPLHLWAALGGAADAEAMSRLPSLLANAKHAGMPTGILVVSRPEEWLLPGFGTRVVHRGDVDLGHDPAWPVVRVHVHGGAERDPFWPKTVEAEKEPGLLEKATVHRPMVSSPTFTLEKTGVAYRVRGSGTAFVEVDSFRLVFSQLYESLANRWEVAGSPRWVWHDLSGFRGHRMRVEIIPGSGECMAMELMQCDVPPAASMPAAVPLAEALSAGGPYPSLDSFAQAYQRLAVESVNCLRHPPIADPGHALLANWLVQRPYWGEAVALEAMRRCREHCEAPLASLPRSSETATVAAAAIASMDGTPVEVRIPLRGNLETLGGVAPRRFLEIFDGPLPLPIESGSGRRQLAERLTGSASPLLARVFVNRLWLHLFGKGIVASADDLGVRGDRPSHSDLLEYLARRLVEQGWSTKALIREMVLSKTYRMSSISTAGSEAIDPGNTFLHCARRRRLDAEAIRDAMLAVSGSLDRHMMGPSVALPQNQLVLLSEVARREPGPIDGAGRRSLYLATRRLNPSAFLTTFDAPTLSTTVGVRNASNVPAQALALMNDPFVAEMARRWAERILQDPRDDRARLDGAFMAALGRFPDAEEAEALLPILRNESGEAAERWQDVCHILFNLKEFRYPR